MGSLGRGTVVPELQRALGIEARALLDRFNLLKPLVEQMVISEAIARVVVSEEQLEQARLGLIQQRGFDGMAQWADLLEMLGRSEDEVLEGLRQSIRRRSLMRERFAAKAEVPSNKIGFVQVPPGCPEKREACMNADISIDSFPSSDFGVLKAKVTRIGSDALEPDPQEQRQELSFPVTIQLDDQQLKLKTGSSLPCRLA